MSFCLQTFRLQTRQLLIWRHVHIDFLSMDILSTSVLSHLVLALDLGPKMTKVACII
jgi:hypothetical protein